MFEWKPPATVGRAVVPVLAMLFAACSGGAADEHPWIRLPAGSAHRIVEFSGADAGQVVIATDPMISRDEALELGRLVQSQAPPRATVNVRIYNDEPTARAWRTAAADMYLAHLLVVVSSSSTTGASEVRWVRPDSFDAFPGMAPGALSADSAAPAPASP